MCWEKSLEEHIIHLIVKGLYIVVEEIGVGYHAIFSCHFVHRIDLAALSLVKLSH